MSRRALALALAVAGAVVLGPAPAGAATGLSLSMDDAVRLALARNRDLIAARLDIDAAATDVLSARTVPNPVLSYSLGNLVLGHGNGQMMGLEPRFFDQPVQTVAISQVIDVWAKRRARSQAAELGVELRKLVAEDAIRTIAHAVRSAFIDVLREQAERALAREVAARYAATTKLSRSRFAAGDISEAELRKVELEAIRYDNAVIDADSEWDLARAHLAVLMGFADASVIPAELPEELALTVPGSELPDAEAARQRVELALRRRPDVRAARMDRARAEAERVSARREAYPDLAIAPTYSHSGFTVSGDNPNVLGVGVTVPLPLFDRNQAGRARAEVDIRRAENEEARLDLVVRHEIADATRRERRARQLVTIYEGGMLKLADDALRTAERLYHAGASSLLEFLEAQRTYLETRGQYLRTRHELRQASVDVAYVVAEGESKS